MKVLVLAILSLFTLLQTNNSLKASKCETGTLCPNETAQCQCLSKSGKKVGKILTHCCAEICGYDSNPVCSDEQVERCNNTFEDCKGACTVEIALYCKSKGKKIDTF